MIGQGGSGPSDDESTPFSQHAHGTDSHHVTECDGHGRDEHSSPPDAQRDLPVNPSPWRSSTVIATAFETVSKDLPPPWPSRSRLGRLARLGRSRWHPVEIASSLRLIVMLALVCAGRPITRRTSLGALAGAILTGFGVSPGSATETSGDDAGADGESTDDQPRYVVGLKPGTATESVARTASTVYRSLGLSSNGSVVAGAFDDETRAELESRSDVRYVEPDYRRVQAVRSSDNGTNRQRTGEPNETVDLADKQRTPWGVERIGAAEVHEHATGEAEATVAILDSGIDPEHESLDVSEGRSFADCAGSDCAADWDDETGHGTHCAGTVAALDNDTGVVGVAPEVKLCALKVLAGDGSGYDSDIAAAIEWCADNDVDVINLSLGGSDEARVLEDALRYAYDRGVLIVAAAGNAGAAGGVDYPAAYDECIAVGATNDHDEVPDWSARGDTIELVAPGEAVLSTKPGDEYVYLEGTSMSTPHVAAIAAQLIGQGLSHADDPENIDEPGGVRAILRESAEDLGVDADEQGFGLLNAFEALESVDPVTTGEVTDVRASTATLTGELRSNADVESAECCFEWRQTDDEWTRTEPESVELGDSFSAALDELQPETAYDVRAVMLPDGGASESQDGDGGDSGTDSNDETTASIVTFETGRDELAVETTAVEADDHRTLQATGSLDGIGDATTDADATPVTASFRVRPEGEESWDTTDGQVLESIGTYEESISGLEPETMYEVEAVVVAGDGDGDGDGGTDESNADETTGGIVTAETDPEPGLPSVDRFELTDDSNSQFVRCAVNWGVSVSNGELELVETELRYATESDDDGNDILHHVVTELEDQSEESGIHTLRHSDRLEGAGESYTVTITVTDTDGNTTDATEQLSLDERSPPPSIDQFDITTDDFLGTPEAVVDWAVSDEGGELDGVVLELRRGGSLVDETSSMARNEEASGTDSLRADDAGEGGTYEVLIRATDYFEQTSEETETVELAGE
ncbi:subtilisin-like serine protease [Natrialba chahannaoensis JCM 10990]|uniref:Subtilisin-like serine protease n=1 Tax=Natrialba chahannaoensis JCM 10990 TaxID=1227492 RepID=M0A3B6_9EURY|nr:S8 family peptidase [Natrialba chahannaoensis]ELY93265.1 subtilisin-like serine protease [Natrialba chahannaoensis JCM 10990]